MNDSPVTSRLPDAAASRAVLIGVGHYDAAGLDDLPSVNRGVRALHATLTDPHEGVFAADRCTLVEDPRDQTALAQPLLTAAAAATDVFLVYHSGHGLIAGRERELYLALSGTDPDIAEFTAMPYRLIREAFHRTPARSRILILDSCHSGRAISGVMAATESSLMGQVDIDGTYVMTSVPAMALAQAPDGDTYTTFTGALLDVLRRGVPQGPELLSLGAIYAELHRLFASLGLPLPQQASERTAAMVALARNSPRPGDVEQQDELPVLKDLLEEIRKLGSTSPGYRAAFELARKEASRRTVRLGADHPETLSLRESMAVWLKFGTPEEIKTAIGLSRAVVADRERVLGAADDKTLASQVTLAGHLFSDGQTGAAFDLLASVRDIRARVFGADHIETLRVEETIGFHKTELGRYDEAVEIYRELMPRYTSTVGWKSPSTLRCLMSFAWNVKASGQPIAAMDLYRQGVELSTEIHGGEAEQTLGLRLEQLACAMEAGDAEQALRLALDLLPVQERVTGPESPDAVQIRLFMVAVFLDTGDFARAVTEARAVCRANERRQVSNSEAGFHGRLRLAQALHGNGEAHAAINVLQSLTDDMRNTEGFGAEHPKALTSARLMADWTGDLGHHARALRMYQQIVETESRTLPREDLQALQSRINLAYYTAGTGDHPAASVLYTDIIDDCAWLLGRDHRVTLNLRRDQAVSIGETGDTVRATNLLAGVKADQIRALGEKDQDVHHTELALIKWRIALPKGPYAPPVPGWLPPAD
ncbi:tetratricopeptide repeat protein [Streptomyces sp. NPDC007157]|uniref:caspase, EACC1-associated type n=1 Tax=Streptomyces sp. NPDC007157 TaxID=3154681 RepID=UPI0033C4FA0F